MNKKEIITFRKIMQPLEEIEVSERVKADGTLEMVKMRFYLGQELNLKIMVFVRHVGNKVEYIHTNPFDEQYISGDDDSFEFDVCIPLKNDDEIVVKAINLSDEWQYNLICDVEVDYYGGSDRLIGGVIRG